jgi:cysteine desulfurase
VIHGGGHENGLRSGTLNVPAIAGFGKAAEIAARETDQESKRLLSYREKLRTGISSKLEHVYLHGSLEKRLPGNLNLSFGDVEGESLLRGINEKIAVSSGSACTSASVEPSYVLRALGVPEGLIHTSVRFGLGRFNTEEEVNFAIDWVVQVVSRLRAKSPFYEMDETEVLNHDSGNAKRGQ